MILRRIWPGEQFRAWRILRLLAIRQPQFRLRSGQNFKGNTSRASAAPPALAAEFLIIVAFAISLWYQLIDW